VNKGGNMILVIDNEELPNNGTVYTFEENPE
jgi:hypothetical protein